MNKADRPRRALRTGAPVTLILLALLLVAALTGPGPVSAATLPGPWWTVLSSVFWTRNPIGYVMASVALAAVGIPVERRLGSWRFAVAALACPALGIIASLGIAYGLRSLMGSWSAELLTHSYAGPSALIFGVAMAVTPALPTLWRRRLRVGLLALLVLLALYSGSFPDLVRLGAAAAGGLIGPVLVHGSLRFRMPAASRREARLLIALVVAASAIGPVLAGVLPHAVGPLAVLRFLFTDIQPVDPQTLQTVCTDPSTGKDCLAAHLQLRAGAGGLFMAILPSVLLLLVADGLRRGRRFAWWAAVVIEGALAVQAALYSVAVLTPHSPGFTTHKELGSVDITTFRHPFSLILPLLLPLLLVVLLLVGRKLFRVWAPAGTYPRLLLGMLGTAAVLAALYLVAGLALAPGFTPTPSLPQLLADIPDRFLPLGYTVDVPPAFFPQSTPAVILYEGIGTVFWLVTAVLLLRSFLRPAHNGRRGEDRARSILKESSGSSLSWMTTWAGNSYWFSASGTSFVAYRVIAGIALSLGPPVGPARELPDVVGEFIRYAGSNGWTPCFYSVPGEIAAIAAARDWGTVQVAQETILDLDSMSFTGRKFQDVRTALNRAQKEGIRARWLSYAKAPLAVVSQINAISEEWVADKGMPEMAFTLGGLDEMGDPEVRCLAAIDDQHVVHAVTSWLPVYRDGAIVGWTLDFMRRRGTGFRAGIEFLIASAALSFKEEGYEFISLSGAPLARTEGSTGTLDRLLDRVGAALEPVYGFRSLLAFKAKFQPRYEPLFMVFPDAAALPGIANAVTRAYLPNVSLGQGLSIAQRIVRRPARAGSR
ncbi:MAG TPA: rhomboid family intramembrane serine protease [Micrococcaceae bacterium]